MKHLFLKLNVYRNWCSKLLVVFPIYFLFCTAIPHASLNAAINDVTSDAKSGSSTSEEEYVRDTLDSEPGTDPAKIIPLNAQGEEKIPVSTIHELSVELGYGGKSNVLETGWWEINSHQSFAYIDHFYHTGEEKNYNFNIFSYYEVTGYPDIDVEGDSQSFFSRIKGEKLLGELTKLGLKLSYSYQQYLDEINAVIDETIPVLEEQDYSIDLSIDQMTLSGLAVVLEAGFYQLQSEEETYDYGEQSCGISLMQRYGRESELGIGFEVEKDHYFNDEVLDEDGYYYNGEQLRIEVHRYRFFNDHYFKMDTQINLSSDFSYETMRDNGPGYSDYDLFSLSEWLQFIFSRWKLTETLTWRNYDYKVRTVTTSDDEEEEKYINTIEFSSKIERLIGSGFVISVIAEWLKSESNDEDEEYSSDSYQVKVAWTF